MRLLEGLVDPGSSATILSFDLFREIGWKASIPRKALWIPEVILRDYPFPYLLWWIWSFCLQGRSLSVPVYLNSIGCIQTSIKKIVMHTDASIDGLGAVLKQE